MHKKILMIILFFFISASLSAENFYQLDPVLDISLATGTLLAIGGTYLYDHINNENSLIKQETLNAFDASFYYEYNEQWDEFSDITAILALGLPGILPFVANEDWLSLGIMYFEVLGLTHGTKEILKRVIGRTRPYVYYENDSFEWGEDISDSFPSGHAALSAASATYFCMILEKQNIEPWLKYSLEGTAVSIALTTGLLRLYSGSHYATDVITGTLIGSLVGWLVPFIHEKEIPLSISQTDGGISLGIVL